MDAVDVTWTGTDKEGPAVVSLSIIAVRENKALLVTYWASPEGTTNHEKELNEIIHSVKSLM